MVRRSRPTDDQQRAVSALNEILATFLSQPPEGDLREKVLSLVPAVHQLRDLGSSLVPAAGDQSGRDRILYYLRHYPKTLIAGDELLIVSGINDWMRRTRELREKFGWWIYTGVTIKEILDEEKEETGRTLKDLQGDFDFDLSTVKPEQYILVREEEDLEAARRWNVLNDIRKQKGSVKTKLLKFFRANVGKIVTGEELRRIAPKKKEWARRTRELRTQDGWPIFTKMQGRPDIPVGAYLLDEDRQAEPHDRAIKDTVRVEVLLRDGHRCTRCAWTPDQASRDDPRRYLELHHLEEHVHGGENTAENLITLCNVDHDAVHRGEIAFVGGKWVKVKGSA